MIIEILAVNDGSTDGNLNKLIEINDSGLTVFDQKKPSTQEQQEIKISKTLWSLRVVYISR